MSGRGGGGAARGGAARGGRGRSPGSGRKRAAPAGRTAAGDALTDLVLRTFRLNGLLLAAAEEMAAPAGLTAARWQVLGAVLRGPLTVSEIARVMGLTRQSVQRLANALVDDGMAVFLPNPAHRRAKLLTPTRAGRRAITIIRPRQHAWTRRITRGIGADSLGHTVATLDRIIARLEADAVDAGAVQ